MNAAGAIASITLFVIWVSLSYGIYSTYYPSSLLNWQLVIVLAVFWFIYAMIVLGINKMTAPRETYRR